MIEELGGQRARLKGQLDTCLNEMAVVTRLSHKMQTTVDQMRNGNHAAFTADGQGIDGISNQPPGGKVHGYNGGKGSG